MIPHHLLFFFSALGVFNSLLVSTYLLAGVKPRRLETTLLGLLMLMLLVRVGVSCFYFFEQMPWTVVQLGLSAHLLMAPLLYVYTKATLQTTSSWRDTAWWHPAIVFAGLLIFGVLYPFEAHPAIWDNSIRHTIHAGVSIYFLATLWALKHALAAWLSQTRKLSRPEHRALVVFAATLSIAAGFVISLYINYILGPLFYSLIFYVVVALSLKRKVHLLLAGTQTPSKPQHTTPRKKIEAAEATALTHKLKRVIVQKGLYKDPTLKLGLLAKRIGIPPHRLSHLLNDHVGQSFSAFVNTYRINEAKHLLYTEPTLTIEAIGYEAGFSSKSSFYTTFKKYTGTTPAAFRKMAQAEQGNNLSPATPV